MALSLPRRIRMIRMRNVFFIAMLFLQRIETETDEVCSQIMETEVCIVQRNVGGDSARGRVGDAGDEEDCDTWVDLET